MSGSFGLVHSAVVWVFDLYGYVWEERVKLSYHMKFHIWPLRNPITMGGFWCVWLAFVLTIEATYKPFILPLVELCLHVGWPLLEPLLPRHFTFDPKSSLCWRVSVIDEGIISGITLEGDLKSQGMNTGGGQGVTIPPPSVWRTISPLIFQCLKTPKTKGEFSMKPKVFCGN